MLVTINILEVYLLQLFIVKINVDLKYWLEQDGFNVEGLACKNYAIKQKDNVVIWGCCLSQHPNIDCHGS